ncbi:IS3 family transposase, partial [Bifidobacterium mongoliense]|uniref:IS3 family transposase n=1 Tax=Bifidobacterium mongoliense TaxID=518643 RepID=UPI003BEED68F
MSGRHAESSRSRRRDSTSSSTGVSRTGRFEREALEGFVADIFTANKARYGYRRINRELRKTGIVVSEKRVLK